MFDAFNLGENAKRRKKLPETKFKRAVKRFLALQKQNPLLRALPPVAHRLGQCACGRNKLLSQSRCYDCQDALCVMRAKYHTTTDSDSRINRELDLPRILERVIAAPVRVDPLAKHGKADEFEDLGFDDIVKLYEDSQ